METKCLKANNRVVFPDSFNFLASLINGNMVFVPTNGILKLKSFNFLASLINGNIREFMRVRYAMGFKTFNFLASLINGNVVVSDANSELLSLLTS